MTKLIRLVRHGRAGHKKRWEGDDRLRPLDEVGERNAAALARLLLAEPPGRLISSPTRRCVQTLEPLAFLWEAKVEEDHALAPDARPSSVLDVLARVADGDVLCTHGEVMGALLHDIEAGGTEISLGPGRDLLTKGTLWELTVVGTEVRRLHHVDPVAER